jgi:hypothetical protein
MKRVFLWCAASLWVISGAGSSLAQSSSASPSSSAPPAAAAPQTKTIEVNASPLWTDTQIDLGPADTVAANATESSGDCHSAGSSASPSPDLTLPNAAPGALIAKVGTDDATSFLVGAKKTWTSGHPGRLYLGMNQADKAPCKGKLTVELSVTKGSYGQAMKSKAESAAAAWLEGQFGIDPANTGVGSNATGSGQTSAAGTPYTKPSKVSNDPLDADLRKELDALPRRVNDEAKNLGDMVNFVIVGSDKQLKNTLTAANWHVADTSNTNAIVAAIEQTMEKQDYLTMPMSTLYLYNRPQDFGYEQAEPITMVASRHHFRIWKAPFTYKGQTVWVGAGTHDIAFEKDQRNGSVTHKIDPAVDGERDNIGGTLQQTGRVKELNYYLPPNPVQSAKNATGGEYHSDGRLLVMFLQ